MNHDILLLAFLGLPCWLLWLLGSLIAFLLGWWLNSILSGYRSKMLKAQEEKETEHKRFIELEKDYKGLQYQLEQAETETKKVRGLLQKCEADRVGLLAKMERDAANTDKKDDGNSGIVAAGTGPLASDGGSSRVRAMEIDYGALFQNDNLQIIEGIGPKLETILKNAGYGTWTAIANASEEDLKKALTDENPNYRIHKTKSWPEQAKLALKGDWDGLVKYQKFLDGGRDDQGDFETPSKVEKLALKILGFKNDPEDLKVIEGIGPKIEELLKNAGIKTWSDLAAASVDRIQEVLNAAGDNFRLAKPETWPRQAELAAQGKFKELKEYQDVLQGGKDPGQ